MATFKDTDELTDYLRMKTRAEKAEALVRELITKNEGIKKTLDLTKTVLDGMHALQCTQHECEYVKRAGEAEARVAEAEEELEERRRYDCPHCGAMVPTCSCVVRM